MTQPIPHSTPPMNTTTCGPYLSTNQPSMGTSQVSNRTNNVNANWIDARSHLNVLSISGTKNVQPYCRLAIMTMAMTPNASWLHRVISDARSPFSTESAVTAMSTNPAQS